MALSALSLSQSPGQMAEAGGFSKLLKMGTSSAFCLQSFVFWDVFTSDAPTTCSRNNSLRWLYFHPGMSCISQCHLTVAKTGDRRVIGLARSQLWDWKTLAAILALCHILIWSCCVFTPTQSHPTSSLGHKAIIVPLHCLPSQTSPIKHGDGHRRGFEKVWAGTRGSACLCVFQCFLPHCVSCHHTTRRPKKNKVQRFSEVRQTV